MPETIVTWTAGNGSAIKIEADRAEATARFLATD